MFEKSQAYEWKVEFDYTGAGVYVSAHTKEEAKRKARKHRDGEITGVEAIQPIPPIR